MAKAFHFFKWTGKKAVVLLVLSIVLTTALVGATVAFIIDITQSLTNTFEPANIDITISGDTIQNTGDADVYFRAAVVVTWVNKTDGTTLSTMPADADYTIKFSTNGWVKGTDGFWYQTAALAPEAVAPDLISELTAATAPEGYELHVQVLSQAIQATPAEAVTSSWSAVRSIDANGALQIEQ